VGHGAGIVQWGWRNGGTIGAPNGAASYLSLLLGPAITLLLVQGPQVKRFHKQLAAAAICFGVPALLLTGSRGGWIALTVSATIICFVAWRRGWIPKMAPFTVAMLLLVALASVPVALTVSLPVDAISERLGAGANGRGPLVDMAWQLTRDTPRLRAGVNKFGTMITDY